MPLADNRTFLFLISLSLAPGPTQEDGALDVDGCSLGEGDVFTSADLEVLLAVFLADLGVLLTLALGVFEDLEDLVLLGGSEGCIAAADLDVTANVVVVLNPTTHNPSRAAA